MNQERVVALSLKDLQPFAVLTLALIGARRENKLSTFLEVTDANVESDATAQNVLVNLLDGLAAADSRMSGAQ